ncbi:hypothetical protein [Streptomyces sp. TLI_185]|uniref:hypothetical protein n=1 Tax=Streptomyces sp. TLI_185 TaxID=2485151 RepID=UPI000FAAB74F|nr:hypothetical protein [Streptomyces sp. TLI_185]RPF36344.1 hypothetical protein EDD92_6380 [Streptomyces sp. TLI_185]
MAHEPLVTVETADFSVTYVLALDDDPETVEDVDAIIRARDSKKGWTATCMTPRMIAEEMDHRSTTGECAGGLYLRIPDIVIVREGGLDAMTRALVDLFGRYGMDTDVLPCFEDDEDEDD